MNDDSTLVVYHNLFGVNYALKTGYGDHHQEPVVFLANGQWCYVRNIIVEIPFAELQRLTESDPDE